MRKKNYLSMNFNLSGQTLSDSIWLPMIPAGEVEGRDGRKWLNTYPDSIVNAFDSKLPFDIEHATEIKGPEGEDAGAVGWIVALKNRNGEIWAQVEWNQTGRWQIEDKRYCFYSPAFYSDPDSGVITAMSSAGLTNKPNFYVPALNREEEGDMKLPKLICDALGISEDATESDAVVAINSMKDNHKAELNRAKTPDLNHFVPKETYTVAMNRAEVAEGKLKEIEEQEIVALVDSAIADGKVAPSNKDMYMSLCRTDGGVEQFKQFVGSAPKIADGSKVTTPKGKKEGELDKDQLALCRAMNISPEDYKANLHHKPTY